MKFAKAWFGVHNQIKFRAGNGQAFKVRSIGAELTKLCQLRSQRSLWPNSLHISPNQAQTLEEGCWIWPGPCSCHSTADSHLALHLLAGAARRGNVSIGNLIQRPHSKTIILLRWLRPGFVIEPEPWASCPSTSMSVYSIRIWSPWLSRWSPGPDESTSPST